MYVSCRRYVLVDTYDKAATAYTEAQTAEREAAGSHLVPASVDWNKIVALLTSERAIDTLLWQVRAFNMPSMLKRDHDLGSK